MSEEQPRNRVVLYEKTTEGIDTVREFPLSAFSNQLPNIGDSIMFPEDIWGDKRKESVFYVVIGRCHIPTTQGYDKIIALQVEKKIGPPLDRVLH